MSDGSCLLAEDVVFATPSFATADLVGSSIPCWRSGCARSATSPPRRSRWDSGAARLRIPLQGAGFIVPPSEGRRITACSWSSAKFQHRAPQDCVLLRVFIGGALAEELAEQDEAALVRLAREELQAILGIAATPVLAKAYRWPKANPQYDLGHEERVAEIERSLANLPGLHLAGAAYHGPGIPDCIQSGRRRPRPSQQDRREARAPGEANHRPFASNPRRIRRMPSNEIGATVATTTHPHAQRAAAHDYSRNPMNIYWEMTQACGLACRHCRAEAISTPHPEELTHAESMDLLRQIAAFDKPLPHLILTGGDPLRRADLYELIDEAHRMGLTISSYAQRNRRPDLRRAGQAEGAWSREPGAEPGRLDRGAARGRARRGRAASTGRFKRPKTRPSWEFRFRSTRWWRRRQRPTCRRSTSC